MKEILSYTGGMESSLEKAFGIICAFRTSAEAVMKASGLRFEAIRAVAREQGVKIEKSDSRCIDENLLSLLADAHVRRLRCYFNNALRHVKELSGTELFTFIDFFNTFKKSQVNKDTKLSWDVIDIDAIREQFIVKVHSLTPTPNYDFLFGSFISLEADLESLLSQRTLHLISLSDSHKDQVISRVINSRLKYYPKLTIVMPCIDHRLALRAFTLCLRYHIFTDDDCHIAC